MNVPSYARTGRFIPFVLALVALCAVVTGASGANIYTDSPTYDINGDTATVQVLVDSLPTGLSGFSINVTMNPAIAEVNFVEFQPAVITSFTRIDADTVNIKAAFQPAAYPNGTLDAVLALMTVRGNAVGSTPLTFEDIALDDVGGFAYTVTSTPATINVIAASPPAPIADFTANVTTGPAPLAVQFTDVSQNGPFLTKRWELGIGAIITNVNTNTAVRTYTVPGNYTVKLTLTNAGGIDQEVKYIVVTNATTPTPTPTPTETTNVTPTETTNVTPTETTNVTPTETTNVTPTETVTVTPTETVTPETGGPFGGPHVPTARIEAENFDTGGEGVAYHDLEPQNLGNSNYRASEGVDIETESGVTNVAYIRAGEYLKYSIDTTAAGNFILTLHASNPDTVAKAVKVYVDGVPAGEVLVEGTGAWTTYRDFTGSSPLTIGTGRHVVTLAFEGINRINLDWLSLSAGVPTTTVAPAPTPQTVPYGPGNYIPGRVQAENFDKNGVGAANAAYYDTTLANEGGDYRPAESVDIEYQSGIQSYDIGWIRAGEYVIYTVQVASPGTYTASFNAANPDGAIKTIDVSVDGAQVGTVEIGSTGSFNTFRTFTLPIALQPGTHQIKLAFPSDRLNLDYIEFANGGSVTTTTAATGGSFVAAPTTATYGSAVKFTVTPAAGKTIKAAWWSFDAPAHLETWNSRNVNPTFFYPQRGTFSPLVKLTYTDGTTETIQKTSYIKAT